MKMSSDSHESTYFDSRQRDLRLFIRMKRLVQDG